MKTTQHAKGGAKKLPKARVMWANHYKEGHLVRTSKAGCEMDNIYRPTDQNGIPVAVIPTATAKQAKAIASFFNLSEDGQVEALAKELAPDCGKWAGECARAVLRRIKERR